MHKGRPVQDSIKGGKSIERLTRRKEDGSVYCRIEKGKSFVGRLAAIEDILGDDYDLDRLRCAVESLAEAEARADEAEALGRLSVETEEDFNRIKELWEADREGRCVVLPIKLGSTLLNASDPRHPEIMKNFRISATWTDSGLVFYSPWGIFLENIEKGYIKVIHEEAEAARKEDKA